MNDLQFTVTNNIARITLNRPEQMNAFSEDMIHSWIKALEEVRDSDEIHVLVISGNGRAFCSGGDIKAMARGDGFLNHDGSNDYSSTALARKNSLWKNVQRIPLLLQEIDIPVIAMLHGAAFGAGFDMALACDIRIAAKSTKIAESYVKAGIVPGDGAAWFLPRLIGTDKALDLLWNGQVLTAEEAYQLGLLTYVIDDSELQSFTDHYVERLKNGPKETMRFMKRAVYQSRQLDLKTSLDMISSAMGIITELKDYEEGVQALVEKRKPEFS
ncbi:enoyl-CoA hydratase [Bacillus sp. FJAT-27916]|uniref:enoyl-CoA hydratase/isomerase family protein n=1 Tax=Bacillaceae TaxID=186817 RepID=UPI0006711AAF|nr:enoyl-CoA hydratase/isomerase family protein [Bacillus sp. FJAT-27916]KMY44485.1 enoyl-CoA hydratase [Bacillus sp. FJAT-27916]